MKTALSFAAVPLLAMAAAPAAQAATIIQTGSYAAGEYVVGFGSFGAGPGKYRVTLQLSGAPTYLYGYVEKQTVTNFFCQDPGVPGTYNCGGDDVPTLYDFVPVTPARFVSNVTVKPFTSTPFPSDPIVRYDEFETCCNYYFEFESGGAGAYSLSLASIPDADTWALMIVGFGAIGAAMRRRGKPDVIPALAPARA